MHSHMHAYSLSLIHTLTHTLSPLSHNRTRTWLQEKMFEDFLHFFRSLEVRVERDVSAHVSHTATLRNKPGYRTRNIEAL